MQVSAVEGTKFAHDHDAAFIEISVKNQQNVKLLINQLVLQIFKNHPTLSHPPINSPKPIDKSTLFS
jgi:hypothetical protein